MVADMVAFVASQFTTSTWDVGAQELCSVVLIYIFFVDLFRIRKRTLGGSGSYMWAPSPLGTLLLLA